MEMLKDYNIKHRIRKLLRYLASKSSPFLPYHILVLLIILPIGVLSYQLLKNRFIELKGIEISSIAQLKVQQIQDFRERGYHDAKLFFGNQSFILKVKSLISRNDSGLRKELYDWLTPLIKEEYYEEILIIDTKSKRTILSTANNNSNFEEIGDNEIRGLKNNAIQYGTLHINHANNKIQLNILVPLLLTTQSTDEPIAILKLVMNPHKKLFGLMQSMPNEGRTGEVLVVKKVGNDVLYLNELRFRNNTAMKFRLPISTNDLPAARAIDGDETVSEGTDYRGKRVLAIAKPVPDTDWAVVVKFDVSEIYSQLYLAGILVSAIALILIVASVFGLRIIWARRRLIHYEARLNDLITIQRLSTVYKLLIEVEQAIVKNHDKEDLLDEICRIVVHEKNYVLCWVGIINKSTGIIHPAAKCGIEEQYLEIVNATGIKKANESSDPAIKSILNGHFFISNDIWNDPVLENCREGALHMQFNSMAVFPLLQGTKTIGALFFYTDKAGYFIDDEIRLLDTLCLDLSYALDTIELEKKEKTTSENLRKNELRLQESENKLIRQNQDLVSLNEKYLSTNEELQKLNNRLEKLNQELVIERKRADESNRLKSIFLANMSHEIRTPMNAIIGFAELLESARVDVKTRQDYCRIIGERSRDLLQIINDILDISKIDSHTVTLYIETLSLNAFLDELYVVYENKLKQLEKQNIILVCVKQNDNQPKINTDILKFRQIFTNLLDNALKFTDSGKIRFGYYSHDEEKITCFVTDTGVGIHQNEHSKIFEIFRQSDNNLKRHYGGTGLGLAICKGNAHLLGGDIIVESEPGKGSTFYFTLKYNQQLPGSTKPKKAKPKIPFNHWKTKEILLIEDDVYCVEYMKHVLSKTGIELHIARTAHEAEEFYKMLGEIDLVLLDIRLPDANGIDLMKQMKSLRNDLPIIAQTGFAMEEDRMKCLEEGFDYYIAKPYKRDEIMRVIKTYLPS